MKKRVLNFLFAVVFVLIAIVLFLFLVVFPPSAGSKKALLYSNVFLLVVLFAFFVRILTTRCADDPTLLEKGFVNVSFLIGIVINGFLIISYTIRFNSFAFLFVGGISLIYHLCSDQIKKDLRDKKDPSIALFGFYITFFAQSLSIAFWLYYFFGMKESLFTLVLGSLMAMGLDQLETVIARRWPPKKKPVSVVARRR